MDCLLPAIPQGSHHSGCDEAEELFVQHLLTRGKNGVITRLVVQGKLRWVDAMNRPDSLKLSHSSIAADGKKVHQKQNAQRG